MDALNKIIALLDKLAPEDKLHLIEIISQQLRQPPAPENPEADSSSRRYLPRIPQMMDWKLLKPKDRLYISGHPDQPALLLDNGDVVFEARVMSIMDWARVITGRDTGINIYREVVLEREQKTLDEIRLAHMDRHGLTPDDIRPD